MNTQKKYLKWYNKVGYGMGDWGYMMVYGTIISFIMLYLTDYVGLDSGIIGILILASKLLDGITDIIFGNIIDRTHTKMGKARPWMFWSAIGNAILMVALFSVPAMGETAQYAYFFIAYTLLNAIFCTINNIAYSALTSLITKNKNERVQLGTIRFLFSTVTGTALTYLTVWLVPVLGGGAAGWRNLAIIYGLISLAINTVSVFAVRELPEEELEDLEEGAVRENVSLLESVKLLLTNKYFVFLLIVYSVAFAQDSTVLGMGIYFVRDVLGNENLLGTFSMTNAVPIVLTLSSTPFLVKRFGMYKTNLVAMIVGLAGRIAMVFVQGTGNIPLLLFCSCIAWAGVGPMFGMIQALIAETSEYTYRTKKKRIDGSMYSCSSLGSKLGNGIGTAVCGMLLSMGGYEGAAAVQSAQSMGMIKFIFLGLPIIEMAVMCFASFFLRVEEANEAWDASNGAAAVEEK